MLVATTKLVVKENGTEHNYNVGDEVTGLTANMIAMLKDQGSIETKTKRKVEK